MRIAVVGAGLMGRVMAMRLVQQGFTDITIFDKDDKQGQQSPATIAGGMLACFSESVMGGELIYQLGKDSVGLWSSYLSSLNCLNLLNDQGTLLLAHAEYTNEIKHYLAKVSFNTQVTDCYELLNKQELQRLEPELNFNQAYYLAKEAVVNAPGVMAALGDYIQDKVNWRTNSKITALDATGLLVLNNSTEKFDLIIDCRGLGATQIYPGLRAIRGEIIRVYAPGVNLIRPLRLFHPRQNIYIAPYADNHYVIGATEIEALDYSPISLRSTLELLSCAYSVHSGFAEARIVNLATNCRPALADNLPQIKHEGHMLAINGLYRHGFLVAPVLAEEVINFLSSGKQQIKAIWR